MLQLLNICKSYTTASFTQTALDNVSVVRRVTHLFQRWVSGVIGVEGHSDFFRGQVRLCLHRAPLLGQQQKCGQYDWQR